MILFVIQKQTSLIKTDENVPYLLQELKIIPDTHIYIFNTSFTKYDVPSSIYTKQESKNTRNRNKRK